MTATIHPTGAIRHPLHTTQPMKNFVVNSVLFLIPTVAFAAIFYDGLTFQPAHHGAPAAHHISSIK